MSSPSTPSAKKNATGAPYDLVAVVFVTGVAEVLAFLQPSIPTALQLLVYLPLLLFIPGYAVVSAVFPAAKQTHSASVSGEVDNYERFVLAIVVSIALAVVSGVAIDFSRWTITLQSVVVALLVPTVAGVGLAAVRRRSLPAHERFDYGLVGRIQASRGLSGQRFSLLANGLVVVAILVVAGSLLTTMAAPPQGETPTEFYEVSTDESGDIVADDYPTSFTQGEPTGLQVRVVNHEGERVGFAGVIILQQVGENGTVTREATLSQFSRAVHDDGTLLVEPRIRPPFSGERLRLTMLLYKSDIPENPTTENAYREIHRWVSVNASG